MPITISAVISDTPMAKTFELAVPETDVIGTDNDIPYTTGGLGLFNETPDLKIIENVTLETLPPTVPDHISIPVATTTHMHVIKTAVAGAGGTQTYRVTLIARRFYEA
jgi:hypothetical protein